DKLGTAVPPQTDTIDPDRAKAYAVATNDDNPAYTSGKCAPPVFGVVPTWGAVVAAAAEIIPPEAMMMIVHGEQDMWFHQPLVPGAALATTATAESIRVGSSGTRFTAHLDGRDAAGNPGLEIYTTIFIRGMADGESGGADKPDHVFPESARANVVGEVTIHVDDDQTFRYAEASGDPM